MQHQPNPPKEGDQVVIPIESESFNQMVLALNILSQVRVDMDAVAKSIGLSIKKKKAVPNRKQIAEVVTMMHQGIDMAGQHLTTAIIEYLGGQTDDAQNLIRGVKEGDGIQFDYDQNRHSAILVRHTPSANSNK